MTTSELDHLIQLLARLPGLGPRSARRAVLHMIKRKETLMEPLSRALRDAREKVQACTVCGNLDTAPVCALCRDPRRDKTTICVVEEVNDLWALERTASFKGLYHVLGGTLSALDGVGPEDLNLAALIERARAPELKEIILATNVTVEGQTTAHYIMDHLHGLDIRVSRLAHGVPVGGELDYLDDGTLTEALRARLDV